MERLTFKNEEMTDGIKCPVKNDYYIDEFCDKVCSIFRHDCPFMNMGKKLKSYEDAEENGLLIHIPCRVGDTVYLISSDGKIREGICKSIQIDENDNMVFIEGKDFAFWRKFERFGITVFFTEPEAEQELKQMGE